MRLYSYVVRYDSGFAPNPFFGFCTLATCKPLVRRSAAIGDWIVGTGSASKRVQLGENLVYVMKVSEILSRVDYWHDYRFQKKKPTLRGSLKLAAGDNIYFWDHKAKRWQQLDSYHSNSDGSPNEDHIKRDTKINRILVSHHFVYWGGYGPKIPQRFRDFAGEDLVKKGPGSKVFDDAKMIKEFAQWVWSLEERGYVNPPYNWSM